MTKITKKPKKLDVYHVECICTRSSYTCPSCNINLVGAGIGKNIVRFKCSCGQELIVENHIMKKSK